MAEEKELKEVCIVEGCPNAGRHFVEEHDDYAMRAAKEWIGPIVGAWSCGCETCIAVRKAHSAEIAKLAAVIRKHAGPMVEQLCDAAEGGVY